MDKIEIRPQKGKQELFLSTKADIAFYGGAAGSGKSFSLLLEALRHINNPKFGAVIFRKEHTQIVNEGGLWDEAMQIYPYAGAEPQIGLGRFNFPSGATVTLKGLGIEKDLIKWQGSQIAYIGFDELTHFSFRQFTYMMSRNRSMSGVKPYIRGTTNPDSDSWVREFIDWWIGEDGYPIEERAGVIRYFVNDGGNIVWSDSKEELQKKFPAIKPKSFTFIPAKLTDNQKLLEKDPSYLANLQALNRVDRERLLYGNWDVRPEAGMYFKRTNFEVLEKAPKLKRLTRSWDLASTKPNETNPDPDWTVGLKGGMDSNGDIVIIDMVRFRDEPEIVERTITNTTKSDGRNTVITIPKDPGAAGKSIVNRYTRLLAGYKLKVTTPSSNKELRAVPASALSGQGAIKIVAGDWNAEFLHELESFPLGKHDDIVDALSDLVEELTSAKAGWDY